MTKKKMRKEVIEGEKEDEEDEEALANRHDAHRRACSTAGATSKGRVGGAYPKTAAVKITSARNFVEVGGVGGQMVPQLRA